LGDFVVVDQDQIMWMPSFGPAVTLGPAMGMVMAGSTKVKVTGKKVALVGDETKWKSMPVMYTSGSFVTPGVAMAKVMMLGPDQKTLKTKVEGKPAVIKGSVFQAILMVMSPAMMPTPAGPVPDPVPMYPGGMGKFITTNTKVKAG
jgi:uncharacterized Zn-binding protein involved in type VI secretion